MIANVRYAVSGLVAVVATFALVILMMKLIELTETSLRDREPPKRIDLLRVKKESQIRQKKRELPKKVQPKQAPKTPSMDLPDLSGAGAAISVDVGTPQLESGLDMKGPSIGGPPSDAESVPVVRVEPVYPPIAAQRGIEGWVVVGFTISANGTVKKPKVLDSKPARIFDDAAVKAVRRWKYNPKIVDGKPIETPGQKVRLTFKLD